MCYKDMVESTQLALFNEFYRTKKSKQVQDLFICSCMSMVPRQVAVFDANRRQRPNQWAYSLTVGHKKISICQKFLRKLFQLSEKRIRVIQTRILNEDCTMQEKRGKHTNRPHRLSDRTLELFSEHLYHLPEREFDESTKQNSASSDMNKKKLYVLFQQYYLQTTKTELKMTYSTYNQLFNDLFDSHVCCPHWLHSNIFWCAACTKSSKSSFTMLDNCFVFDNPWLFFFFAIILQCLCTLLLLYLVFHAFPLLWSPECDSIDVWVTNAYKLFF